MKSCRRRSPISRSCIGYVGAAATKSIILGVIILATARAVRAAAHRSIPLDGADFLVLTAVTFSLFGFIIGIWADGFEKLQMMPMLIVTPLTFLGGSFYSIEHAAAVLAHRRRCSTRWSIWSAASAGASTASPTSASGISLGMTLRVPRRSASPSSGWIFRTGY